MGGEASITGVATAVPLFVGYTECAGDSGLRAPLYNQVTAIGSMAEFVDRFGGPGPIRYGVQPSTGPQPDFTAPVNDGTGEVAMRSFDIVARGPVAAFNLYWQMRLFFANGGGDCLVVSAGSYWAGQSPISPPGDASATWQPRAIAASELLAALEAGGAFLGATMIVVPEACLLGQADYASVAQAMLAQAALGRDRMAILDLPGCLEADTIGEVQDCQSNFWLAIAPQVAAASYGAAYAPALNTTIVARSDILFPALAGPNPADNAAINAILTTQAGQLYAGAQLGTIQGAIAAAFPLPAGTGVPNDGQYSGDASGYPASDTNPGGIGAWRAALTNLLLDTLPLYATITDLVAAQIDVQPPSGLMAGVWSQTDAEKGVWYAPANIALAGVAGPLFMMSDAQQAGFNLPANGVAINILRAQPNRGTVVWGARTLDGNSNDHRYVQVQRTLIYIERSIRIALETYAFSPNAPATWTAVTAAVSDFLAGLWQAGGLIGTKPSDAFSVRCGLGTTMTGQDLLDGNMIVDITLQMIHPAEFIVLRITQPMRS